MKRTRWIQVLLLMGFFTVGISGQQVVEEIVAIVNNDIITLSQYRVEYEMRYQMLRAQYQGEELGKQLDFLKKNLLDVLITDVLLKQEAETLGLNVDEQMKMYIENLKKENNIETDEELFRIMRQQGTDPEEWRSVLRENIMKEAVIVSEVQRTIVIDESETVNYYKLHPEEFTEPPEYKLKAIYLSSEEREDDEIEAKKREINEKLAAGEDFSAVAKDYSEGPEKESGGDLVTFKKGELEKNLEEAVEKLNVGEMTIWLVVRNGEMLLKLEERKEERLKSFEEVKSEIEQKIFNQRSQKKIDEYLENLRKKSFIKILKPSPLDY